MGFVQVFGHVGGPGRPVLFHPALEHLPQGDDQLTRRFVPGRVGAADKRPQVTHGQVVPEFDGSIGPIAPFGGLYPRHEGLG